MKSDGEEKVWTMDDLIKNYQIVQKEHLDAEKRCQSEETGKKIWRFTALAILCVCLYNAKHSIVWVPDPNDRQMRVNYSDWWGIEKRTFYPVWRKPSGEEGWDSTQWCIKYPDGTWQVFLKDDMESVYYEWPEKGYSSPQKNDKKIYSEKALCGKRLLAFFLERSETPIRRASWTIWSPFR